MTEARQYGRRMRNRRYQVLHCGHLGRVGDSIFKPPGQVGWICQDCALGVARGMITGKEAQR